MLGCDLIRPTPAPHYLVHCPVTSVFMADWISFSLCLLACHVAFTLTDALNFLSTRIFSSVGTGKNLERDSIVAKRCTPYRRFFKFQILLMSTRMGYVDTSFIWSFVIRLCSCSCCWWQCVTICTYIRLFQIFRSYCRKTCFCFWSGDHLGTI